jgi:superfamily I DNA/RNA helicase
LAELYSEKGIPQEFDNLIVDEGQDLPISFYMFASRMCNSITVFADENQAIFETTNSSIKRIRKSLKRFSPKEINLSKNHRNTKAIARLATLFMVKGIETGKTEEAHREGELPLICHSITTDKQIDFVINYANNHKNLQIGIFLSSKIDVIDWYNKIKKNSKVPVQYYVSGRNKQGMFNKPPKFDMDGIFLVTHHSAKGLEFDTVFVPQLNNLRSDYSTDDIMRLYVVCSRPRDRLILMYTGNREPEIIENIITKYEDCDKSITKRYNLDDHDFAEQDRIFEVKRKKKSEDKTIGDFLDMIDEQLLSTGVIQQFAYERICEIIENNYKHDNLIDKNELDKFLKDKLSNRLSNLLIKLIK